MGRSIPGRAKPTAVNRQPSSDNRQPSSDNRPPMIHLTGSPPASGVPPMFLTSSRVGRAVPVSIAALVTAVLWAVPVFAQATATPPAAPKAEAEVELPPAR